MENTDNLKNNPCRICGNNKNNTYYSAKEMMYGFRDVFEYYQCGVCKCLQIVDIIDDMSKYYPSNYYSFSKYSGKDFLGFKGWIKKKRYNYTIFNNSIISKLFLAIARKKGYDVLSDLKITKTSRILDVGCGNGEHFLYPLAEVGFKNITGCDPYISEDISYDNGLEIKKKDVFEINNSFDIITYHHAFEHLPNPAENLKKVNDLLSENGVCIIRIPTVSSYAWEQYKSNWVQLDAPRHFFLHSKKSIELLAEENGLELFDIKYDSNHLQFTGSELYLKDIPLKDLKNKEVRKMAKKHKTAYNKKAKELNKKNEGDQAAFFLRKKSINI